MGRKSVLEPIVMMQDPLYAGGTIIESDFISVKNIDDLKIEFLCFTSNVLPLTMTVYAYDHFKEMQPNGTFYSDGIALDFGAPITLDNTESDALIHIDCRHLNTIKIALFAAGPVAPGDEMDYKVTVTGKVVGA